MRNEVTSKTGQDFRLEEWRVTWRETKPADKQWYHPLLVTYTINSDD